MDEQSDPQARAEQAIASAVLWLQRADAHRAREHPRLGVTEEIGCTGEKR